MPELPDVGLYVIVTRRVVPTAPRRMVAAEPERLMALKKSTGDVSITAVEMSGLRRIRLKELNLTRVVSAYVVAGRRRSVACATLLNLGGNRHASTLD